MSKCYQNPIYSPRALEQQWMNNIFQSHDLWCGCQKPIIHLLTIVNKNGKAIKPEEEINNILCLITGEKDSSKEEDNDFGPGELEALFAEDGEQEKDITDTDQDADSG